MAWAMLLQTSSHLIHMDWRTEERIFYSQIWQSLVDLPHHHKLVQDVIYKDWIE